MYREYEVIEVLPNGSRQMVTVASSLEFAKAALEELAKRTHNECFAADAKTRQIVMQMNVATAKLRATKRVFQIAYAEDAERNNNLAYLWYGIAAHLGSADAKGEQNKVGAALQPAERAQLDRKIEDVVRRMPKKPEGRWLTGSKLNIRGSKFLPLIRVINRSQTRITT